MLHCIIQARRSRAAPGRSRRPIITIIIIMIMNNNNNNNNNDNDNYNNDNKLGIWNFLPCRESELVFAFWGSCYAVYIYIYNVQGVLCVLGKVFAPEW